MSHDFPETRASLLVSIRDPENVRAWTLFSELYRPVIYRMARRRGMQDADAQDLSQKVLVSIARTAESWKPGAEHGRFRHWLSRVTRNAIIDEFRKRRPDTALGGSDIVRVLHQSPGADQTEIDYEYERAVFRRAAGLVRPEFVPETWNVFWQSTVEGQTIPEVAQRFSRSTGSVYTARSRVMKRLREVVEQLRGARHEK